VRAEVEELGRIREESRRVARDIEEALRLSSSVGSGAAGQERKVAPLRQVLSDDVPKVQDKEDE
jgi:hypothetical protein